MLHKKKHARAGGLGAGGAGRAAEPRAVPTSSAEQVVQTFSWPKQHRRKDLDTTGEYTKHNGHQLYPQPMYDTEPKPYVNAAKALATEEQQEAYCRDIVKLGGMRAAARAYGFNNGDVFYFGLKHPEFRQRLNAANAAHQEKLGYECNELVNDLIAMPAEEANLRANSYRIAFEWRMRLLGKLNQHLYGEKPTTQVNNNNLNLVVDEETRKRIQDLREKILVPKKADVIENQ